MVSDAATLDHHLTRYSVISMGKWREKISCLHPACIMRRHLAAVITKYFLTTWLCNKKQIVQTNLSDGEFAKMADRVRPWDSATVSVPKQRDKRRNWIWLSPFLPIWWESPWDDCWQTMSGTNSSYYQLGECGCINGMAHQSCNVSPPRNQYQFLVVSLRTRRNLHDPERINFFLPLLPRHFANNILGSGSFLPYVLLWRCIIGIGQFYPDGGHLVSEASSKSWMTNSSDIHLDCATWKNIVLSRSIRWPISRWI